MENPRSPLSRTKIESIRITSLSRTRRTRTTADHRAAVANNSKFKGK